MQEQQQEQGQEQEQSSHVGHCTVLKHHSRGGIATTKDYKPLMFAGLLFSQEHMCLQYAGIGKSQEESRWFSRPATLW